MRLARDGGKSPTFAFYTLDLPAQCLFVLDHRLHCYSLNLFITDHWRNVRKIPIWMRQYPGAANKTYISDRALTLLSEFLSSLVKPTIKVIKTIQSLFEICGHGRGSVSSLLLFNQLG